MPSALRSRIALLSLMGCLLIPIGMSGLRGLTHVLTCSDEAETPFTLVILEGQDPQLLSSSRLERGQEEEGLCDGLFVELGAAVVSNDVIKMDVPITNTSEFDWKGTVQLKLGSTSIPVDIGEVPAGATVQDEVEFTLDPGTFEVNGSLLIGP